MVWQTKLLKYIRVELLFVVLFFSSALRSETYYDRCDHRYATKDMVICSEVKLPPNKVKIVQDKYNNAHETYEKYIPLYDYKLKSITIPLTVYIVHYETLNNKSIFTRSDGLLLQGRYKDWVGKLYTHYDAVFTNSTDFVHELAHYFNNNIPVLDATENEEIARRFEEYYLDNS